MNRAWVTTIRESWPSASRRQRRILRAVELTLGLVVVVTPVVVVSQGELWSTLDDNYGLIATLVGLGAMLGVPLVLAGVTLAGAALDGLRTSSVVVAILALETAWYGLLSVYTLLNPPEGGGVFFGGLLTLFFGLLLAIAIGLREFGRCLQLSDPVRILFRRIQT